MILRAKNVRDYFGEDIPVPDYLDDTHADEPAPGAASSPAWGFRLLWSTILLIDAQIEVLLEAVLASVGRGSPSALAYLGWARKMIRWQDESNASYAARLRRWIDTAKEAGGPREMARQIHGYLRSKPKVRVFNRAGNVVTVDTDGTVSTASCVWDWDSISHPERASFTSELFVVVYVTTQWPTAGDWGTLDGQEWGGTLGFGHDATPEEYDAIRSIVADWKAAHSNVRAIIWTTDPTLFDPAVPASLPDGQWGDWSMPGTGAPSHRNTTTCRYWEMIS